MVRRPLYVRLDRDAAASLLERSEVRGFVFPRDDWCALLPERESDVVSIDRAQVLADHRGPILTWSWSRDPTCDWWTLQVRRASRTVLDFSWAEYDDDHQEVLRPVRYFRCYDEASNKVSRAAEQARVAARALDLEEEQARSLVTILRSSRACVPPDGPSNVLSILKLRPLRHDLAIAELSLDQLREAEGEFSYVDVDETRDEVDLEPATELGRLVAALVEHGAIRLTLNATRVAADLAGTVGSGDLDAARLADALLEQDGVDELFWTDEQLERFLSQW